MRIAFAIVLALACAGASAFDSAAWLERRAGVDREAAALRQTYSNCVAVIRRPAEDVTVPIENWPDGTVKSSVHAERAQFFIDEGLVWCSGVRLVEFEENGAERSSVEAESCVVDRNSKRGWAEGKVRARYGKTRLEGCGIYFSFSDELAIIYSNVKIETEDLKFEGVKL